MQTYAPPRDPTAVMGRRIGAYVIDAIIAWVVSVITFIVIGSSVNTGGFDPCGFSDSPDLCVTIGDNTYFADGGDAAVVYIVPILYWLAIQVFLQGATGMTPGKAVFGLRAVRRDTGEVCGLGKAFVRSILWIVDAFPYCFPLVGLITGLSTDGHKRVGDMAAGTAVVGKDDVGTPLDGAPPYDAGQQWAAPAAGYGAAAASPPPPAGYAPPPPQGFAAPAPPAEDWSTPAADPAPPPPQDWAAPAADPAPPPQDWAAPAADPAPPPPQDWSTPAADPAPPPPQDWAAPDAEPAPPPPQQDWSTPAADPAPPAQDWAAPTGPPVDDAPPTIHEPIAPADEAPVVQSNQPPVTSEPQWDAARNTYIQWDPVLAAWMQWDEPAQRWKHIDT